VSAPTSLFLAVGATLVVFGVLSAQRRQTTARRVAAFVGPPLETIPQKYATGIRVPLLRNFSRTIVTSPSGLQTLILAVVIGGILVGCVTGGALAFTVAAVAALLLLVMASRTESQARTERQAPSAI